MRYFLCILFILFFSASGWALEIESDVFENGGDMSSKYAYGFDNVSPPLRWNGVPAGTVSLALICDDPDSPSGKWTHWIIFNIPAKTALLPEGIPKEAVLEDGSTQGTNDFGRLGYDGPYPPPGKPHRYFFRLYALNETLNLSGAAARNDLLKAIRGHIISESETFCLYPVRENPSR
ncbi:MAG: YbhB/YbcL family Raf kinase inhibitor-like protein [Candidatus Omnitrophota bacterium]